MISRVFWLDYQKYLKTAKNHHLKKKNHATLLRFLAMLLPCKTRRPCYNPKTTSIFLRQEFYLWCFFFFRFVLECNRASVLDWKVSAEISETILFELLFCSSCLIVVVVLFDDFLKDFLFVVVSRDFIGELLELPFPDLLLCNKDSVLDIKSLVSSSASIWKVLSLNFFTLADDGRLMLILLFFRCGLFGISSWSRSSTI